METYFECCVCDEIVHVEELAGQVKGGKICECCFEEDLAAKNECAFLESNES